MDNANLRDGYDTLRTSTTTTDSQTLRSMAADGAGITTAIISYKETIWALKNSQTDCSSIESILSYYVISRKKITSTTMCIRSFGVRSS
jgi:hypothetical protein